MTPKATFYEAVQYLPHDNHESDLYLLDSPEARALMSQYGHKGKPFISQLDGKLWWDIPFAYEPFWQKKVGT